MGFVFFQSYFSGRHYFQTKNLRSLGHKLKTTIEVEKFTQGYSQDAMMSVCGEG